MKNRIALLTVALVALFSPGCALTQDGERVVDWNKVDVAGDEVIAMLDANIIAWQHRPETADRLAKLRDVAAVLDKAATALAAGEGDLSKFSDQVDAAIAITDAWMTEVDAEEDRDLFAVLVGVRGGLGLIRVVIA